MFDETEQEIEERRAFLEEMRELGNSKHNYDHIDVIDWISGKEHEYEAVIKGEIAERCRDLEVLHKHLKASSGS